jgi:hypothetical protein
MFHAKDGWFFERLADGSVLIMKKQEAKDNSPIILHECFDRANWCSIVASVSAQGENSTTWDLANKLHG